MVVTGIAAMDLWRPQPLDESMARAQRWQSCANKKSPKLGILFIIFINKIVSSRQNCGVTSHFDKAVRTPFQYMPTNSDSPSIMMPTKLLPITLLFVSAITNAESVVVTGTRLQDVISLEKYQGMVARIPSFGNELRAALILQGPKPYPPTLVLVQDDHTSKVAVLDNGEIDLPNVEKLLRDGASIIALEGSGKPPEVKFRVILKLPNSEVMEVDYLRKAVAAYEQVIKSSYGWASFLVPTLDCLMLEYPEGTPEAVAEVFYLDGKSRQIKARPDGLAPIELGSEVTRIKTLHATQIAWGCKYSRWTSAQP